jgi:lipase chaperone LimK
MLSLLAIVADKKASAREKTAAAKALMAADSLNVQQERMDQADEHERRQRMVELARQLSPGEVARLSAESGVVIDGFIVDEYDAEEIEGRGEDGPKEGGGT